MIRLLHDVHLEGLPDRCRRVLMESPARWLPSAVEVADGRFRARVGFGDVVRVEKEVAVTVRPPAWQADRLVIPLSWHATGPDRLFPVFEGELRLRPMRPRVCRLSLIGAYDPPLGKLGRRLDGAGMCRVAEATVSDLVRAVAARVSEPAALVPVSEPVGVQRGAGAVGRRDG